MHRRVVADVDGWRVVADVDADVERIAAVVLYGDDNG